MSRGTTQNSFFVRLNQILGWIGFVLAVVVVIISPWLFGAWEAWWFWPFAACIFAGIFVFALRMFLFALHEACSRSASALHVVSFGSKDNWTIAAIFIPFIVYAFVRFLQAEVYMTAERSFLLFLTPFLLGVQILFGFSGKHKKILFSMILLNLYLLGVYGLVNHIITGSRYVLWEEGYPSYVNECRATGSYFCPDHFAGIMEIALCLGLGLLLSRDRRIKVRLGGVMLAVLAVVCVVLSKSRGGGLTLIIITAGALVWGFSQWSKTKRWCYRASVCCLIAMVLIAFFKLEPPYVKRFNDYFTVDRATEQPFTASLQLLKHKLRSSSRGHMISGAVQAWKTEPIIGVGPGMHQILWPYFATSPDGDRESGRRPAYNYTGYHSYEVHSDWVQLLEEYGIIGVLLFVPPVLTIFGILLYRRKYEHPMALGAFLSCIAMGFHSLGDFNLQMPATAWMLTAIVVLPLIRSDSSKRSVSSSQRVK